MRFAAPRAARLILPAVALLAAFTPFHAPAASGSSAAPAAIAPKGTDGVASYYRPEVRLRKLHLVRPDLIPYPLAYEVYC